MRTILGTVVGGQVVVGEKLVEGQQVAVVVHDELEQGFVLSAEEELELAAAMAEPEVEQGFAANEVFASLPPRS